MWSYTIVDTMTGDPQLRVLPFDGSWGRALNRGRGGSHTFQLADVGPNLPYRELTTPWGRTLVVSWAPEGGTPIAVYAGLIVSRKESLDERTLTVNHSDLRALLARRTTFGENGYNADGDYPLTGKALSAIAGQVVWAGTIGPTDNYGMPIDRVSGDTPGTAKRHYWDYNLTFIDPALQEIQEVDGGPDIDFEPYWSAGKLRWQMRAGTTAAPALTGGVFEWNMSSAAPGLLGGDVMEDAKEQATSAYAVGRGSEQKMKVAWARVGSPIIPALERVTPYKDIKEQAQLQAHATADLAAYRNPTKQWNLSVLASSYPGVGLLRLGSTLRLYYARESVLVDAGWTDLRLIGMSGGMGERIMLDVQPVGGA